MGVHRPLGIPDPLVEVQRCRLRSHGKGNPLRHGKGGRLRIPEIQRREFGGEGLRRGQSPAGILGGGLGHGHGILDEPPYLVRREVRGRRGGRALPHSQQEPQPLFPGALQHLHAAHADLDGERLVLDEMERGTAGTGAGRVPQDVLGQFAGIHRGYRFTMRDSTVYVDP
jgi:hypothetical protein